MSIIRNLNKSFAKLFQSVADGSSQLSDSVDRMKDGSPKVVYIAGKVTGLVYDDVKAKFDDQKEKLIESNFIVISPCDFVAPDENWKTAMAICFNLLPFADFIYLLPDWELSKGAKLEKLIADQLGIPTLILK